MWYVLMLFFSELPNLRKMEQESEFVHCRVSLIIWLTNYVHQPNKKNNSDSLPPLHHVQPQSHTHHSASHDDEQHESSHPSLDSSKFVIVLPKEKQSSSWITLLLYSFRIWHKSVLSVFSFLRCSFFRLLFLCKTVLIYTTALLTIWNYNNKHFQKWQINKPQYNLQAIKWWCMMKYLVT